MAAIAVEERFPSRGNPRRDSQGGANKSESLGSNDGLALGLLHWDTGVGRSNPFSKPNDLAGALRAVSGSLV